MRELTCDFVAPIPVGSRVEITSYHQLPAGRVAALFGERPKQGVMVRDLDTGIVYGPDWLWGGSFDEDRVRYSSELADDERRVSDEVTPCAVESE